MERMKMEDLTHAETHSPFLAQLIARNPELTSIIKTGDFDGALCAAFSIKADTVAATLRKQRQGVALVTAIADLSDAWDLTRVTRVLSDFADTALEAAIAAAIEERVPGAPNEGFTVIALGKHGGQELNYSSDIDPIFLFDPKTLPCRNGDDPQDSAVRIGKRVIELLHNVDENGYVFRVDMRLRPSPEVSPVALPVEAAIGYYESSALAWEQAAFIRARVSAGDKKLGAYFLDSIQSFIWRRSLDFGQLKNIQQMSAKIRDHYSKGQKLTLGYDLKRGRGGIRECEFFAQAHQLIHGGRDAGLRIADTRSALAALANAGWIAQESAAALSQSYTLLRITEHRLQMIDDRQTHSLPDTFEKCDQLAALHGLGSGADLLAMLSPHIESVRAIYDELAGDSGDNGGASLRLAENGLPLQDQLGAMGFADPAAVTRRLIRWRSGKLRAIRSEAARDAFEAVLPDILSALGHSQDPESAIARFDNLIGALPSAVNFFLLLEARPALLQLVAHILCYAPTLADALGQRAELLDGLIDASALDLPKDVDALCADMHVKARGLDYQSLLDMVRVFVSEKRFALGVQLIEARYDPLIIARGYAHLAEAALDVLTRATVSEFETAHGKVLGGELVILALGRLGGEALTHASDLDLVFLFTGSFETESDGERPLGATQYFNRLAQRVVGALSVPTASGALYEIDTRLRPSGAQGLLCVSLDSFAKYQHKDAWVWEHMALTRARPVYGSDMTRSAAQAVIDDVFARPRDTAALLPDIIKMRGDISQHKPPKGALDVKLLPGGLVDAEFVIHALQLSGKAPIAPQLDKAIALLIAADALPPEFASACEILTRFLIILRLVAPDCAPPPVPAQRCIANCLGFDDWPALMAVVENARAIVLNTYEANLGPRDSN
jgi:[glutamine synthetase] adenylyltransferase / [glutamine synthetase]-adenylyl-L-tyrosine phosphorylase